VLGVCFGAQALARALGGAVTRMADPEIGWVRVDSDDPELIEPGPWFQWHFDAFTVPPGAVRLAWNQAAPQAYRVGRSLGVQFHPEITAPGIEKWLDNGGESEARAHGVDPAALVAEARSQEAASRVRADSLIEKYLVKIFAG
jgi:GMP synthase-like glutamine amidotransferase